VIALQLLPHHIGIAVMLPEARRQPLSAVSL
jgi:hypothetical protein